MTHAFDLKKPSHLIANDVLRQLEILMSGSGLHVTFGTGAHDLIEGLIAQYQDKLMEANNKSVDTLRDRMTAQSQSDDEQEAWLRGRLTAMRFPVVEDVYVSTAYSFYVSFERLLTTDEINRAIGVNLEIERTFPLKNRYRVVFLAPDVEE